MMLPFEGYTLDWYSEALANPLLERSIVNSATYRDVAALAGALPGLAREYADAGIVRSAG